MAVDKKITELPALPSDPVATDLFLAVRGDVDYKLTGTQLAAFISAVISVGSAITFSNDTPPNTDGKNGDVVIKPATGEFLQKVAGVWVSKYTTPAAGTGNTVLYGSGVPNNATGANGDTYINTLTGVFYKKAAGVWAQVFSMATGPAGATGAAGANGTNGTNGKTILNGVAPPSNIDDGTDGDFYLNTATKIFYGPKAAGVWPAGFSLVSDGPAFKQAYNYDEDDERFNYNSSTYELTFTLSADDQLLFPYDAFNGILDALLRQKISATKYKTKRSFDATIIDDGTKYISVMFEGVDSDLITGSQIILS